MPTPIEITVTGTIRRSSGPVAGRLVFTSPSVVREMSGTDVYIPDEIIATVGADGVLSVDLPATNDPDFSPTGWTWHVQPHFPGWKTPFDVSVPYDAAGGTMTLAELVPVPEDGGAETYALLVHTHAQADVTGLVAALDGKADDVHVHIIADTTGLQAALDGKAEDAHVHVIGDTTGLQAALDGKSDDGHGHAQADVTGLVAALAAKLDTVDPEIEDTTFTVLKSDGSAALRFRSTGGAVDIDKSNGDIVISSFAGAGEDLFGGAQTGLMRWRANGITLAGYSEFGDSVYGGAQAIDGANGVAQLGAKNGLANLRICGYRNDASGPPTTGTWEEDDIVLDVNGHWWRCMVAGTPGSWQGTIDHNAVAVGETTIPRNDSIGEFQLTSGMMVLTYFTAMKTEAINNIRTISRATAASGTTLARAAFYDVATNGDLAIAASTANDTAMWAGTYARWPKPLSATWNKVAGRRYAFGVLWIGTTGPRLSGQQPVLGVETLEATRMNGSVSSLLDIPNTVANASINNTVGGSVYAVAVP